ncbi:MAG TPA: N-acetylmuramoyl-L-alanine amidase [Alphaproteobacteria bacterium]|nr:N-acetylmuramoyl-L-alanine amidase [Alphaproteobacteria bacterium]
MNGSADIPGVDCPSPNHDARPAGRAPDMLVLHYTGMRTGREALDRLCDSSAKVSAHYMIEEDGTLYRLVPEDRRAWHAGVASWQGEADVNGRSIGIELVNPGHEFGYRAFTEPQMQMLDTLAGDIVARYRIPPSRVVGHSDVAPLRKQDPGELFDWPRLARLGIGLWPGHVTGEMDRLSLWDIQAILAEIGYGIEMTGEMDALTRAVIAAFQRHFLPENLTGEADMATIRRLMDVKSLV